ncbi:MAG: hypothetical protein QOE11_2046 [Solirubrobacteraceae bacterium]|jgi:hypothetical protein|nr:hypothetical protein [Solirubrobacteraceae bacterium]
MTRSRSSQAVLAVLAVLALACACAPAAQADGDPASDTLYFQDVFYPYQPAVSPVVRDQLRALLRRVRGDGLRVKVAIIASRTDLGTQAKRFDKPKSYAELLGVELEVGSVHDYVLVSMPRGLGTYRYDERGLPVLRRSIAAIRGPGVADPDALARTAGKGLVAMAAATGHPVPEALAAPFTDRAKAKSHTGRDLVLALLGMLWLAAIAGAFRLRAAGAKQDPVSAPQRSGNDDAAAPAPPLRA